MTTRRAILGPWRLGAIFAALVLAPFCLWGFQVANAGDVPWERWPGLVGSPGSTGSSAPPYMAWDIGLMVTTAALGSLAVLYLAVELWLEIRWNRRRAAER